MQILLVEDDERMAKLLHAGLTEERNHVYIAANGRDGLALTMSTTFDVIVLDLTLPFIDGLTLSRRLRETGNQTPILMLTAKDGMQDIVKGLDAGADDYLTKPFSFEVLLARLRAVSRRGPIPGSVCRQVADLRLDTSSRLVTRGPQPIHLTPTEYDILELLLRNMGRPLTRDTIVEAVWGFDADIEANTVDVFVRLLRNKVDYPFAQKLIHTVRGVGYCLRSDDQ